MHINRHGLQFSRRDTFDYTSLGSVMASWLRKFQEHGKWGCNQRWLPDSPDGSYTDEQIEAGIAAMNKDIDRIIFFLENDDVDHMDYADQDDWLAAHKKFEQDREEVLKLFAEIYPLMWR